MKPGNPIKSLLVWDKGAPPGYIGDPAVPHTVTGSPLPTPFNKFKIVKADDTEVFPGTPLETDQFIVSGKLYSGTKPTPLIVTRASYNGYVQVFAKSGLPDAIVTATFGNSTETLLSGLEPGAPSNSTQRIYYGSWNAPKPSGPIVVTARAPGRSTTMRSVPVEEEVVVSKADYDPMTGILTINAKSGTLSSLSYAGKSLNEGALTLPNVYVPPAFVTVISSTGGSGSSAVLFTGSSPNTTTGGTQTSDTVKPATNPDKVETAYGAAIAINVLANDADASALKPATVTPTNPAIGTISVNQQTGIITYTPPMTSNPPPPKGQIEPTETTSFTYTVADLNGTVSNATKVDITIKGEDIQTTSAECRRGTGSYRIRGTDTLKPNTIIALPSANSTSQLGSAPVDNLGDFDLRFTQSTCVSPIFLKSMKSGKTISANVAIRN